MASSTNSNKWKLLYASRPKTTVLMALILTLPAIIGSIKGDISLQSMLIKYLIALVLSWIGLSILAVIVSGYLRPKKIKI